MKKCQACNLEVNSVRKTCPLCLSVLQTGDLNYEKRFPTPNILPQKRSLFLRILAFLSVVGIITSIIVNIMFYQEGGTLWSLIVVFNIGYFWLLLKSTFKKSGNVPIRLVIQTIATSLLVFVIDYATGYKGWAINYVIPSITSASLLSILILSMGSKSRYINYFLHIVTAILLGFIPPVLIAFGLGDVGWPALASACLSFVSILGLIIIGDKETKEEIKKRFHI